LSTGRRAFAILAAAFAFALPAFALPGSAGPWALATSETLAVQASASFVEYGRPVTITGTVVGEATCLGSRTVLLAWKAADADTWVDIGTGTTAPDGTFSFESTQGSTGHYRATLPEASPCAALSSGSLLVRVRARVEITLVAGSLTAGRCGVSLTATVSPGKAGQQVKVQRSTPNGWATTDTLTLDDASEATGRLCASWEDIGVVHVRARWPAQDPLNETATSIALAYRISEARWMKRIDALAGDTTSVALGMDGTYLYERADTRSRTPASNEKLALSMALLDTFGRDYRIVTHAAVAGTEEGVVAGDLWILGRGDPEVSRARIAALAERIADGGITRVRGRIMGSTSYFRHDWWATGWRKGISRDYVALPTALTFRGNVVAGVHVRDPEQQAAVALTNDLETLSVAVAGTPGAGPAPRGLTDVAAVHSRPLGDILTTMNRWSSNFDAEVLGKLLGASVSGTPGTIAKGAAAIESWAAAQGVDWTAYDSSGLSYADRATAGGIVRLLWAADEAPWGRALRLSLPKGGQGTLHDRLRDVTLHAKTGSLENISALSGWVWLEHEDAWAEFSILSSGLDKPAAASIEDRIVRLVSSKAR
jgi:D-alanyl-D-alanine carboxypeptidase/D-alanyl-D-alanine-endopeptidase (penicillin-binding protein 4)